MNPNNGKIQEDQICKPTQGKPYIEYQTNGKFGHGKIVVNQDGARQVEVYWRGKPPLFTQSSNVDLKYAKCNSLPKALEKACHSLGYLPTFSCRMIKGPKALVMMYSRGDQGLEGYATLSKPNQKTLRFSLDRINTPMMQCKTPEQALRKAAFVSGKICLLNNNSK
jgi:hypothetical protein